MVGAKHEVLIISVVVLSLVVGAAWLFWPSRLVKLDELPAPVTPIAAPDSRPEICAEPDNCIHPDHHYWPPRE